MGEEKECPTREGTAQGITNNNRNHDNKENNRKNNRIVTLGLTATIDSHYCAKTTPGHTGFLSLGKT
jgi:hypothetical protein